MKNALIVMILLVSCWAAHAKRVTPYNFCSTTTTPLGLGECATVTVCVDTRTGIATTVLRIEAC